MFTYLRFSIFLPNSWSFSNLCPQFNCYNLLGENDVQTKAMLQDCFERAYSSTPCMLVLRHIHGMFPASQANANDEGNLYWTKFQSKFLLTFLRFCHDSDSSRLHY